MIDFRKTWLPQIRRYALLLQNEQEVFDCWVNRNCNSSVENFDELIEQIFDDLDSDRVLTNYLNDFGLDKPIRNNLVEFLESLKYIEQRQVIEPKLNDMRSLLNSPLWKEAVACARKTYLAIEEFLKK